MSETLTDVFGAMGETAPPTASERPEKTRTLLTYDQVPALPREWAVPGIFAYGEPTMFVAEGGTGKGVLMAKFAALFTSGDPFPGQPASARCDPKTVILISPEDDRHKDMRWRLDAAGADVRYVVDMTELSDGRPWTIDSLPALAKLCKAINDPKCHEFSDLPEVGLVDFDPLMKLAGGQGVAYRNSAVQVMARFIAFAREAYVCAAIMHHTNRDGGVNGSRGLEDSLRLAFRIDRDKSETDLRCISNIKSNNTDGGQGLKYRIKASPNGYPVAEFVDQGEVMRERIAVSNARMDAIAAACSEPEPVSTPYRVARMLMLPGEASPRQDYLGDVSGEDSARDLAQNDQYARGTKLVWQAAGKPGMSVSRRMLPGGGEARYAAYPLSEPASVPHSEPATLPVGRVPLVTDAPSYLGRHRARKATA